MALAHQLLVDFPVASMAYIMKQPLGLKQNTVIKLILGHYFTLVLQAETPLSALESIRICIRSIAWLYTHNTRILMDIAMLIQGRTYNPWKNRVDHIHMETDCTVMSVIMFAVAFIACTNLIVYYVYFLVMATFIWAPLNYICERILTPQKGNKYILSKNRSFRSCIVEILTGEYLSSV